MTRPKDACTECGERKNHNNHIGDTWIHDHASARQRFGDGPRKRINPRSAKLAAFYQDVRVPAVKEAVGDGRNVCQMGSPVCTGWVQGLHEIATSGREGGIRQSHREGNTIPACHPCNGWASEHPLEATERGWLAHATPVDDSPPEEAA